MTTVYVKSVTDLKNALLVNAIDTIVVANGTYHISAAYLNAADSLWIGKLFAPRITPVSVIAETRGGVTFDGGGCDYLGGISFQEGVHDQVWDGFNFANGKATLTGVIFVAGYPTSKVIQNIPPYNITMRNISFLPTCLGDTTTHKDHAIYISDGLGGPHDLLFENINVDGAGGLGSAFHFYHSDPQNNNAHDVTIRNLNTRNTYVGIYIADSTLRNITVDGALIAIDKSQTGNTNGAAIVYENFGQGIVVKNVQATGNFLAPNTPKGTNPPGITLTNNQWNMATLPDPTPVPLNIYTAMVDINVRTGPGISFSSPVTIYKGQIINSYKEVRDGIYLWAQIDPVLPKWACIEIDFLPQILLKKQ